MAVSELLTVDAGDIATAIEAGRLTTEPHKLDLGDYYVLAAPGGIRQIDLTGDQYRPFPRRKAGNVHVADAGSFLNYWARHSDGDSEIYADPQQHTITAILDAHRRHRDDDLDSGARWRQHRLTCTAQLSEAWRTWLAHDGKAFTQIDFAEFIEDQRTDIHFPAAATLLEIVQTLEGTTTASWQTGVRLTNGTHKIVWMEETAARAGQRGELEIPTELELHVPIFQGATHHDRVIARFRYRIDQGRLSMFYKIHRPMDVITQSFGDIIDEIADHTQTMVMHGTPS